MARPWHIGSRAEHDCPEDDMATKIDYKRELRELFAAAPEPALLDVPELAFAMVDGHGDPNTAAEYAEAVEALYAVAYAAKFAVKRGGGVDYGVMPLEGLWWNRSTACLHRRGGLRARRQAPRDLPQRPQARRAGEDEDHPAPARDSGGLGVSRRDPADLARCAVTMAFSRRGVIRRAGARGCASPPSRSR